MPMPIPPVLNPVSSKGGTDYYELPIRTVAVGVLPGRKTSVLSYGNDFFGPTIRARSGRPAVVTFRNGLTEHANVHLHGAHVEAADDGHPMDVIEPGAARSYRYPNQQRGATLWYHDHVHHLEAEHVYRGLRGFYLIDDPAERQLNLPHGQYDVPIMLTEAKFAEDGTLVFDPANPFDRPTLLANGRPQPYLRVRAGKYRFRILNGSTHRVFTLSLDGAQMQQIASDGGLLPAPVPVTTLKVSPAERAEVVVDFSAHPVGTQLVLSDTTGPVLRFDVVRTGTDKSFLPPQLRPLPPVGDATVERDFELGITPPGEPVAFRINGRTFDHDRVDIQIKRGTTEIWRITNLDTALGIPHNFHLHLAQFRVLDRDGRPPAAGEAGVKDTVLIEPGSTVRIQATFRDYVGRYLFHCHFLEHSGLGMMAQMEIVP
ncbi:multicopper oxidase family protein [Krasilnikovia sp. M28-CT-15]